MRDWEFIEPPPPPDPLIAGAIDATMASRGQQLQRRSSEPRKSPLFYAGQQNGAHLVQTPGGEPVPATLITNGSIEQGAPMIGLGSGVVRCNQMPRVTEERPPESVAPVRSYGVSIFYREEISSASIGNNLQRNDLSFAFWIGGDRLRPFKFAELATSFIGELGVTSGVIKPTYLFLDGNKITFHFGFAAATATSPDKPVTLLAKTFLLQRGVNTVAQTDALNTPYGNWTRMLEVFGAESSPEIDNCVRYLTQLGGVALIGGKYYQVNNLSLPSGGSPVEIDVLFQQLRSPGGPENFCPLSITKQAKAQVYPVDRSSLGSGLEEVSAAFVTSLS